MITYSSIFLATAQGKASYLDTFFPLKCKAVELSVISLYISYAALFYFNTDFL